MRKISHKPLPILVVDDEHDVLESFRLALLSGGLPAVTTCADGLKVMDILEHDRDISVILLDLMMPKINGQDLLEQIIGTYPGIPVIVITAIDDLQTAVNCMRLGAFDYLVKPVEKHRLVSSVFRALEILELGRENRALKESFLNDSLRHPELFAPIVGRSSSILKLFKYIEAIGKSTEPVLISGETGVGKELFARAVHNASNPGGPFIAVNVAGLDDQTFSDTLFGHRKGAFTGAESQRDGLIKTAEGGTLFLDEIGDLSLISQVKLLRLLQEQEYFPLGSDLPKKSTARILVATHCDLGKAVQGGTFRKDLFYRLQTHQICIPPLRKRKEDLPLLVDEFLERAAKKLQVNKPSYSNDLLAILMNYDFPGNIRELETLLFDCVSRSRGGRLTITTIHDRLTDTANNQPGEIHDSQKEGLFDHFSVLPTLKEATQQLIKTALERASGNQSLAARFLGLSQPALSRRLNREKDKSALCRDDL